MTENTAPVTENTAPVTEQEPQAPAPVNEEPKQTKVSKGSKKAAPKSPKLGKQTKKKKAPKAKVSKSPKQEEPKQEEPKQEEPKQEEPKQEVRLVSEKSVEKRIAADEAQALRRAEAKAKADAEREARLASKSIRNGRGRPPVYTGLLLNYLSLLLSRYGATGARRRASAVKNGTTLEKVWRKEAVAAWSECLPGHEGDSAYNAEAPVLSRVSMPTLVGIAERQNIKLPKGRPALAKVV